MAYQSKARHYIGPPKTREHKEKLRALALVRESDKRTVRLKSVTDGTLAGLAGQTSLEPRNYLPKTTTQAAKDKLAADKVHQAPGGQKPVTWSPDGKPPSSAVTARPNFYQISESTLTPGRSVFGRVGTELRSLIETYTRTAFGRGVGKS